MTGKKAGKEGKKSNILAFTTGKRKRAIARAWFRKGQGTVRINFVPLELFKNEIARMRSEEHTSELQSR